MLIVCAVYSGVVLSWIMYLFFQEISNTLSYRVSVLFYKKQYPVVRVLFVW